MRVGVISDTHGLLRPEAEARLTGADHIIHAGDIGAPEIVPRLGRLAPVTAIRGNVDRGAWAEAYPETAEVMLAGRRIFVLHDLAALGLDPAAGGAAVVISGHSHRPKVEIEGGVLYLNPGSAGRRRFRLPVTLATLDLTGERSEAEIHDLAV
jgi:putative phosphoesterase